MDIIENKGSILLKNIPDFNIIHTFECGQCFRWDKYSENSYIGIVEKKVLIAEQFQNDIILHNINIFEFNNKFRGYFDVDRDYGKIKDILKKDKTLNDAINFGWGIRILYQDIWECLISFIISANNRIPMIKRCIKNISSKFGEKIIFDNKEFYSFPTPEQLQNATIEELERCGSGFRAKYIKCAVEMMLEGKINLKNVEYLNTESAQLELQKISGVGPKVADCVLLFSAHKYDAFPIDVWVKRVMEYFYSDKELKLKDISQMKKQLFGDFAGFAQQYLFYYARELKIGK